MIYGRYWCSLLSRSFSQGTSSMIGWACIKSEKSHGHIENGVGIGRAGNNHDRACYLDRQGGTLMWKDHRAALLLTSERRSSHSSMVCKWKRWRRQHSSNEQGRRGNGVGAKLIEPVCKDDEINDLKLHKFDGQVSFRYCICNSFLMYSASHGGRDRLRQSYQRCERKERWYVFVSDMFEIY